MDDKKKEEQQEMLREQVFAAAFSMIDAGFLPTARGIRKFLGGGTPEQVELLIQEWIQRSRELFKQAAYDLASERERVTFEHRLKHIVSINLELRETSRALLSDLKETEQIARTLRSERENWDQIKVIIQGLQAERKSWMQMYENAYTIKNSASDTWKQIIKKFKGLRLREKLADCRDDEARMTEIGNQLIIAHREQLLLDAQNLIKDLLKQNRELQLKCVSLEAQLQNPSTADEKIVDSASSANEPARLYHVGEQHPLIRALYFPKTDK
ncbi:DNA-binding protein [Variovorax rhizosphaerae]|uniref:DNA-binding protein n=1 Tax=Variovorax rhizosphaerae TaxID=1836200 RepID=A0ABU8WWL9_9BURK